MNSVDSQYLEACRYVLENGEERDDRTGVGTLSVFGYQMRFDLNAGFPMLTTKRVFWKGVAEELLFFLRGDTNAKNLQDKGVHIWDAWMKENGDLGRVYGAQWRDWRGADGKSYDQVKEIIDQIKNNGTSRRLLISAWKVDELNDMVLVPCHFALQFYVSKKSKLSCRFLMRSTDVLLGLPFNISSYALLTHMVAQVCGLGVGELVFQAGDLHIYSNHLSQVQEQLTREPRELPTLELDPTITSIDDFRFEHMKLLNYNPHPAIKAPIAV